MDPLDGAREGGTPLYSNSIQRLHIPNSILERRRMNCSRCGGCLATEPSLDFYHPDDRWRCINCGAHGSRHSHPVRGMQSASRRTIPHVDAEALGITSRP